MEMQRQLLVLWNIRLCHMPELQETSEMFWFDESH